MSFFFGFLGTNFIIVSSTQKPRQYFFLSPSLPSAHMKLLLADVCQVLEVSVAPWECLSRICCLCAVLQHTLQCSWMSSKAPCLQKSRPWTCTLLILFWMWFLPPDYFLEMTLWETVEIEKHLVIWMRNVPHSPLYLNTWFLVPGAIWEGYGTLRRGRHPGWRKWVSWVNSEAL